jgi:hypothetical protein
MSRLTSHRSGVTYVLNLDTLRARQVLGSDGSPADPLLGPADPASFHRRLDGRTLRRWSPAGIDEENANDA